MRIFSKISIRFSEGSCILLSWLDLSQPMFIVRLYMYISLSADNHLEPLMYRSIPKTPIPPRANPRAFDFFEKFWSNSRYVASLDGQMPHPLELQRGSNPPPSRHVSHEINEYKQNRLPLETNSAKFSATTNFLFSLSSLHT